MFCWRGLKFFSPLRVTNSFTTHNLLSYFFWLNTLKDTAKAPAVDLLRLNTLRDTKTAFLTPKRYNGHPRHFYMGAPQPPSPDFTFPGKQTTVEHQIYIKEFLFTLPGCESTKKPTGEATTTGTKEGTTVPGKETTRGKPTEQQTTVTTAEQTTQVTTGQPTTGPTTTRPTTTKGPATSAPSTTKEPSTTAKPTTPVTTRKTTGQTTATTAAATTALPTTQAPTTIVPSDKTFLECGVAIVGGGKN